MTETGSDVVRLDLPGDRAARTTICKKHKRPMRKTKGGEMLCPLCENPFLDEVWRLPHKDNRNAIILVEGPTGTGKSYFCLKLAEDLDPKFFENPVLKVEMLGTRVLFKPSKFAAVLNKNILYQGAVVIIEEGGVQADHRKWYSFNNMVFNYILETFRFMKLIVIVNVPVSQFLDSDAQKMFHYHVETRKVDYKKNLNIVKIKSQTYNSTTKKIYRKFLRYKINGRWIKFVMWRFPRAGKVLWKEYEKLHREFKRGLIDEMDKEMRLIEKQDTAKKQRIMINEDDAVAQIIANPPRYIKQIRGRQVVDKSMVEADFNVGRGIGERIKKRAEWELNPQGV